MEKELRDSISEDWKRLIRESKKLINVGLQGGSAKRWWLRIATPRRQDILTQNVSIASIATQTEAAIGG